MKKRRSQKQTVTTKREPISKKLRFDIFNRDQFTCTYCGQKAPSVVLHVDHIKPVAKGGTNKWSNLTTACSSCNGGKSATEINNSKSEPLKSWPFFSEDHAKYFGEEFASKANMFIGFIYDGLLNRANDPSNIEFLENFIMLFHVRGHDDTFSRMASNILADIYKQAEIHDELCDEEDE